MKRVVTETIASDCWIEAHLADYGGLPGDRVHIVPDELMRLYRELVQTGWNVLTNHRHRWNQKNTLQELEALLSRLKEFR
jgi:hypothetical protein